MKINKKIKFFAALLMLFYLLCLIDTTYAKYVTSADANTNMAVARWNILINNQDLKNNSNFTSTIKPTFIENQNIADGIIAPTSEGYFDIILDGSKTDVGFKYTISIEHSSLNTVKDLIISKYTIDDSTTEYTLHDNEVTDTISYTATNKKKKYRFYVMWKDGVGEEMDNEEDTLQASTGIAALDIKVNVIQMQN